jgi:hypothetical protein
MELNFQKIENKWVAEFVAPSNFNLHLEREKNGYIIVQQRGTDSGEYYSAYAESTYDGQKVFDCDFGALVYPKWIKIISEGKVNVGVVTLANDYE